MTELKDSAGRVRKTPAIDRAPADGHFEAPPVVVDPIGNGPKAVALEYRRGERRAPVVTAFGKGQMAEQIIAIAKAHGVYVQPDPDLVELLAQVDVGMAIPPQLYYVIAEILAFVYKLNGAQAMTSQSANQT